MGKGWDRASFDMNTRPDKIYRDIGQEELLVSTAVGGGALKLAGLCFACGLLLAVLWLWPILTIAGILGLGLDLWLYPVITSVGFVAGVALFVFSRWDFKRVERWGREA
jgi:hypothetical protein